MALANISQHDENDVTTLLGVSSSDGITPVTLYANPTTHRLLVSVNDALTTNETPSGAIDGTNPTYTLVASPVAGTLQLYHNGVRMTEGAGNDFTLSGSTITMNFNPESGDTLLADYQS